MGFAPSLVFVLFNSIMRRLVIFLSVLSLSVMAMRAEDYRLFLEDFNIDAGETVDISLYLDNVDEITGIQADIVLPEGLTVTIDDEGYYCVMLNSSRKTRNHTIDGNYQADGAFRIVSYTSDSKPFKLNTGEIATITVTASPDFKGTHTITVRNIELAAPDGTQFFPDDESCIVTGPAGDSEVTPVEALELNCKMANLAPASSFQLAVTTPEAGTITWSSEDESVATVDDNGLVTAKKSGMVAINATNNNGVSTWCAVFVDLRGDTNLDEKVSIGDVTTLISYLLSGNWP